MPNRVVKESIWRSPNLSRCDRLTCEFFFRLLPAADDFGCFEADPSILHGKLYGRCYQDITDEEICNHLITLANNSVIGLWVEDETLWGYFLNWEKHQTIRNKHRRKTPPSDNHLLNNQGVVDYLKSFACNCIQLHSIAEICVSNPNPNPNPNPKNTNAGDEKKPSPPARLPKIDFDFSSWNFINISDADKTAWKDAYPAISVDMQIKKAREWIKSHPENRKTNYRKFLNGWLCRAQEKAPPVKNSKPGSRDPCYHDEGRPHVLSPAQQQTEEKYRRLQAEYAKYRTSAVDSYIQGLSKDQRNSEFVEWRKEFFEQHPEARRWDKSTIDETVRAAYPNMLAEKIVPSFDQWRKEHPV